MLFLFLLPPPGPGPALAFRFINISIPKFISPAARITYLSFTTGKIQLFMGHSVPLYLWSDI